MGTRSPRHLQIEWLMLTARPTTHAKVQGGMLRVVYRAITDQRSVFKMYRHVSILVKDIFGRIQLTRDHSMSAGDRPSLKKHRPAEPTRFPLHFTRSACAKARAL